MSNDKPNLFTVNGLRLTFGAMDMAARFVLVIGVVFFFLAIQLVFSDTPPSTTRRWSWLIMWIYNGTGAIGLIIFYALVGVLLLAVAVKRARKT